MGITFTAIAVVGFAIALLQWSTVLLVLVGAVLIIERDEWLSKQAVKAFYVMITYNVVIYILNQGISIILSILGSIPFVGGAIASGIGWLSALIRFVLMAVYILVCGVAMVKVSKKEEIHIPIIDGLVNKTFGIIEEK